jgi:DNA helicase-2/ATP-dependent DNA helicase PcrA
MKFFADLHIHSRFSRACSKRITLPELYRWSRIKGITVLGTGDFTHQAWMNEIQECLEEGEEGLFKLKKAFSDKLDREIPPLCMSTVRFILSVEISLIYKRDDKVRKVHQVILVPSIKSAIKLNKKLGSIGNLKADGRPILGLDSRDLLDIVLETDPQALLIPAHIWTPWFSIFGDKSGFNSLEECFGDLTQYIYAIETGMSSDPPMNWMIKDLDKVTIISNSDAHSPEKIAREANIFNCGLSYSEMINAIKKNDNRFEGTIEFFPEEGKYHYDGHRLCNVSSSPSESIKNDELCPRCSKRLTIGVLNRVYKLAKRPKGEKSPHAKPYFSIVPLKEILSEIYKKGVATKTVNNEYFKLISQLGSELNILLTIPLSEIQNQILSQALARMRDGAVTKVAGYDGVYGKISVIRDNKDKLKSDQLGLM